MRLFESAQRERPHALAVTEGLSLEMTLRKPVGIRSVSMALRQLLQETGPFQTIGVVAAVRANHARKAGAAADAAVAFELVGDQELVGLPCQMTAAQYWSEEETNDDTGKRRQRFRVGAIYSMVLEGVVVRPAENAPVAVVFRVVGLRRLEWRDLRAGLKKEQVEAYKTTVRVVRAQSKTKTTAFRQKRSAAQAKILEMMASYPKGIPLERVLFAEVRRSADSSVEKAIRGMEEEISQMVRRGEAEVREIEDEGQMVKALVPLAPPQSTTGVAAEGDAPAATAEVPDAATATTADAATVAA